MIPSFRGANRKYWRNPLEAVFLHPTPANFYPHNEGAATTLRYSDTADQETPIHHLYKRQRVEQVTFNEPYKKTTVYESHIIYAAKK